MRIEVGQAASELFRAAVVGVLEVRRNVAALARADVRERRVDGHAGGVGLGRGCHDEDRLRERNTRLGQAELKQGYYDYMFAVVPSKEKKPDLVTMQNNFYQTPDEYNIRFYMYDYNVMCFRLLGYQTVGAKPMGS